MLVNTIDMLDKARRQKFAIPSTNFINADMAKTFVEIAEQLNMPLILSFAQSHRVYISLEEAANIGKFYAENAKVPVALHLDHGTEFEYIQRAISLGFTSIMFDGSEMSFRENIEKTKIVVELAHDNAIPVEAELGHVGANDLSESNELTDSVYTRAEDVNEFIEQTKVDSLAISIGTAHGAYRGIPKINFDRLDEINRISTIPLVLHGGSSSGDDNLEKCATNGISKINIYTDFVLGANRAIKYNKSSEYLNVQDSIIKEWIKILEKYYRIFHTMSI